MSHTICFKDPYDTADQAERAAHFRKSRKRKLLNKSGSVRAFKCEACGKYHWGHSDKRKSNKKFKKEKRRGNNAWV